MNDGPAHRHPPEYDTLVDRMRDSLNRLAAHTNDTPPNLDEGTPRTEPFTRRRWAIAAATATLIVAGTAAVAITTSGDPANSRASQNARTDRDGPVIFYDFEPGPHTAILLGEADGHLEVRNRCTWIRSRWNDKLSLILWPKGTRWDPATSTVTLDNGKSYAAGNRIIANGPGYHLRRFKEVAPGLTSLVDQCRQTHSTDLTNRVFIQM